MKKSVLRIYDNVGVSNRVELVLYALSHWQDRTPESGPQRNEWLELALAGTARHGEKTAAEADLILGLN